MIDTSEKPIPSQRDEIVAEMAQLAAFLCGVVIGHAIGSKDTQFFDAARLWSDRVNALAAAYDRTNGIYDPAPTNPRSQS